MKTGAYFYPLTTRCAVRNKRTEANTLEVINEISLSSQARSIFKNQNIPHAYCLGTVDTVSWDDEDEDALKAQVSLAQKFGIDFFIFDSYMGLRDGQFVQELEKPLDDVFIGREVGKNMQFGLMIVPESPRCVLPVSIGYKEQEREYEMDIRSAYMTVDVCIKKYWNQENYLKIDNRPYISFYMSQLSENEKKRDYIKSLIKEIRDYSLSKYHIDLYIVGVVSTLEAGTFFESVGVDALTGYANLPNFRDKKVLQDYEVQLFSQYAMWEQFKNKLSTPFVPSSVVGWDATPRCKPGYTLESAKGNYPFVPIIVNSSAQLFGKMLESTMEYIHENVPKCEQYAIICAWNEVSESMALLPEVCNNVVDFVYLETVNKVKEQMRTKHI